MSKKKISLDIENDDWDMFKKLTRINLSNGTKMINILVREYNDKHKSDLQGKFDFKE